MTSSFHAPAKPPCRQWSAGATTERREADTTRLYETDFYAWTNEQAKLLREGRLQEADIANIVEEIESMGRTERRELASHLRVLLADLLEWACRPDERSGSWKANIVEQRSELLDHLADNPSLAAGRDEFVARVYGKAIRQAAAEILDDGFWPD